MREYRENVPVGDSAVWLRNIPQMTKCLNCREFIRHYYSTVFEKFENERKKGDKPKVISKESRIYENFISRKKKNLIKLRRTL